MICTAKLIFLIADLFYYLELTSVDVCSCSAPLQLLAMGLFPASPLWPTLAVDLNMLDYVNELFVRSPPNTTAWCDSLEAFLGARSYKLETRDAIRRRFGNALQWYGHLIAQKELLISGVINEGRLKIEADIKPPLESEDLIEEGQNQEPPPSSSPTPTGDDASDQSHETTKATPDIPRPSEYLRQRCPLCFGGDNPHDPNFM